MALSCVKAFVKNYAAAVLVLQLFVRDPNTCATIECLAHKHSWRLLAIDVDVQPMHRDHGAQARTLAASALTADLLFATA